MISAEATRENMAAARRIRFLGIASGPLQKEGMEVS
jgi:hypothetical protein